MSRCGIKVAKTRDNDVSGRSWIRLSREMFIVLATLALRRSRTPRQWVPLACVSTRETRDGRQGAGTWHETTQNVLTVRIPSSNADPSKSGQDLVILLKLGNFFFSFTALSYAAFFILPFFIGQITI